MNDKIFKAYDIRGAYPDELTEETAYEIGKGFANYIKKGPILVGRDTRLSSPSLNDSLIKGITDQGVNVVDIGLCSTSCFYYTVGNSDVGGGIMTTASHAPKIMNGFKPVFKGNIPFGKKHILELKEIILEDNLPVANTKGTVIKKDPTNDYVQAVRNSIKENINPIKVVMDSGNGMAGLYIDKVFSGIGLSIIPIFTDLDGNFPNHETNPKIPENRIKLSEKIVSEKADLGFMFDGDADRLYILDRNGEVIAPSLVLAVISEYMISNSNKKKIVVEVRTSQVVKDWVEKAGGSIEVTSAWTIPIKLKMRDDSEIVFGGETSGHYIFPELHETDDGIFAALTFLQAISAKEESIDEIIENFKEKYFVIEEINFEMTDKSKADELLEKLKNKYASEGAEIMEIDGLSVIFPDWHFNLRKSQAEPYIRLNMEATSQEMMEGKKDELIKLIKEDQNSLQQS